MKKAKDLRDLTVEELEASLRDLRKDLFCLRNQKREENKLEQPHLLKTYRKDIARIHTVLQEKKQA